ncbi:13464_t:CDS:2, partial [Acaulospora colombiana]
AGSFDLEEGPDPAEVLRYFIRFVLHLKTVYAQQSSSSSHLLDQNERSKCKARRRSRRRQLLKARETAASRYELSPAALETLRLLGVDGMSSEESEGEVGKSDRQYRIKILPWRSTTLTKWLHTLDQLPSNQIPTSKPRPRRTRIPTELMSENRTPPMCLPTPFFDQNWLNSISGRYRATLELTNREITLPSLAPYGPLLQFCNVEWKIRGRSNVQYYWNTIWLSPTFNPEFRV